VFCYHKWFDVSWSYWIFLVGAVLQMATSDVVIHEWSELENKIWFVACIIVFYHEIFCHIMFILTGGLIICRSAFESSYDMATPPPTTPAGNPPASPTQTTTTTQKAEAEAPTIRWTRTKTPTKKMVLKFYKLGLLFTTYPKKRKRSIRGGLRNVKSCNN